MIIVTYMVIAQIKATVRPTKFAQREVAKIMYLRGKSFLRAAMLLRREGGYEYVVLHILCQGIEVILKGLLLLENYDKYRPLLRVFGHDLAVLVKEAIMLFRLRRLDGQLESQLNALNTLYRKHLLRYASSIDILIEPSSIESNHVLRKTAAVIRLCERQIEKNSINNRLEPTAEKRGGSAT
jgi:hypothetical protein